MTDVNSGSVGSPSKMPSSWDAAPYAAAFLFPLTLVAGVLFGGVWTFAAVALAFVVMPLVELVAPNQDWNPSREESKALEQMIVFRAITWAYSPIPLVSVAVCAWCVQSASYTLLEMVGLTLSCATVTGGIGITVAHELMHKHNSFEQSLSKFILLFTCYMHFFIEHLEGHHKRVATPDDPASARLGENLYEFIPRSVYGSFVSAWNLEQRRLRIVHDIHTPWTWRNQMLWFMALPVVVMSIVYGFLGGAALAFFVAQSVLGFSLLEVVNYIEHYGLARSVSNAEKGTYERVSPLHSWNADHSFSNFVLFKLQRHADHHTWPARRYQTLRTWEFSPKMPTGYTGMMILAFIPPLWRFVMDSKVQKYNELMAIRVPAEDTYNILRRSDAAPADVKEPDNTLLANDLWSTEYIDPFLQLIPAQLREAYSSFSPAYTVSAYFPTMSLEWLGGVLPPQHVRNVRRLLRYVEVRTAQLLTMLGSSLAWLGMRLGARGPALMLLRFGMHICHLSESMIFGSPKERAKGQSCSAASETKMWRSHSMPVLCSGGKLE